MNVNMKYSYPALLIAFFTSFLLPAQDTYPGIGKVDGQVLENLRERGHSDCLLWFEGAPDLSLAKQLPLKGDRGTFVHQALLDVAETVQADVRKMLDLREIPYRAFYLVNAIALNADLNLIRDLAAMPSVSKVIPDPWVQVDLPEPEFQANLRSGDAVEWGIQLIGAVDVWDMGYRGEGVVIGGQDTGYDWKHPAIINSYRGLQMNGDSSHAYNWHDAISEISPLHMDPEPDPALNDCGLALDYPCDDNNHGTHTMGTMTGLDGENEIGVAPEAKWIGCRNMERGYGKPSTYIECFEFFLAPTNLNGTEPDPMLAPDIINNSWSCPEIEGCNSSNWLMMEEAVNNLKQAGILVVVSAGNSGRNGCSSINTPSAIFESSFTIGAVASNDTIAAFSSRGLVTVDSSNRMKPNVVAPGVGVRSAIRGDSYASFSGTSMAGPHTAGAAALLINAVPELRGRVELIEDLLESTAVPKTAMDTCGGIPGSSVPNPVYGYGRIDVKAAVEKARIVVNNVELTEPESDLRLVPNPAVSSVTILGLLPEELPGHLELFDTSGRLIRSVQVSKTMQELDVQDLNNGMYYFTYRNDIFQTGGKLIKL